MAKTFSEINVKAATITGAVVGVACWLFGFGIGFNSMPMYGFTSGMMGSYNMMGYAPSYVIVPYFLVLIVTGAIVGAIIGIVYNWALKLK